MRVRFILWEVHTISETIINKDLQKRLSFGLVSFVLWHFNSWELFNAKLILVDELHWSYLTHNWVYQGASFLSQEY